MIYGHDLHDPPGRPVGCHSKKVYGDEKYAGYLMEQNLPLLDIFEFDAGTVLNTPALLEEQDGGLPPWRFQ